jgi:hypothetical protein
VSDELERWAPKTAAEIGALPSALRRKLNELATDAEVHAKNLAPVRSGALRRSIRGQLRGLSISLSVGVPYGQLQEEGGVVRGRPWLTVPLSEAVRRSGRARDDSSLFPIRLRDGRLFLVAKVGDRIDFRWRLVRAVRIKPQPFMRPALERLVRVLPAEFASVLRGPRGR